LKEGQIVNRLAEEYKKKKRAEATNEEIIKEIEEKGAKVKAIKDDASGKKGGIIVEGIDDVAVRFSKCCSPVPGDEIVGFVTRGRGVSIHRTDCINVINMPEDDRKRLIEAEWRRNSAGSKELYKTEIIIYCNNRRGILFDITKIFTEREVELNSVNARTSKKGTTTINIGFEIESTENLAALVSRIRAVEGVLDIERTSS